MIPMLGLIFFPGSTYFPFLISLISLGILGLFVGKYANGSSLNWAVALIIMGFVVSVSSVYLNIIG